MPLKFLHGPNTYSRAARSGSSSEAVLAGWRHAKNRKHGPPSKAHKARQGKTCQNPNGARSAKHPAKSMASAVVQVQKPYGVQVAIKNACKWHTSPHRDVQMNRQTRKTSPRPAVNLHGGIANWTQDCTDFLAYRHHIEYTCAQSVGSSMDCQPPSLIPDSK